MPVSTCPYAGVIVPTALLAGQGYKGHKMITRQLIANTVTYLVASTFSAAFLCGRSGISCSFLDELANRDAIEKVGRDASIGFAGGTVIPPCRFKASLPQ